METGEQLTDHSFGGDWTEVKLAALEAYSVGFIQSIQQRFDLWYFDPFAGTGTRKVRTKIGAFFDLEPASVIEQEFPGSAARALSLQPPFHHYRFGDIKSNHAASLRRLVERYPDRDASVFEGDGNQFIQEEFAKPFWTRTGFGLGGPRALVFLDPYGLAVQWDTLRALAACGKADVWFLANLSGSLRQLAHRYEKIDASKQASLAEVFGTSDWVSEFYKPPATDNLLGLIEGPAGRTATKAEVAAFHRQCLQKLFRYVSEPLSLRVGTMDDFFLLYCMSNSPSPQAIGLIHRLSSGVIKRYRAGISKA